MPIKGTRDQWRARNPGQQWQTRFDASGFMVQPASGAWTWGLTLQRYGVAGNDREVRPTGTKLTLNTIGQIRNAKAIYFRANLINPSLPFRVCSRYRSRSTFNLTVNAEISAVKPVALIERHVSG